MSRNISEDLNNPNLFNEFQPGVYEYSNDEIGKTATGSLQLTSNPTRNPQQQRTVGGDMRRENGYKWGADDGGHLIGARFGGSPYEENLTAQNRNLNRSAYKHMENTWATHLEDGDKVFVHMETTAGERPDSYMGYAIYESPDGSRTFETYSYNNESSYEQSQWEEDFATYEAEHPEEFTTYTSYDYANFDSSEYSAELSSPTFDYVNLDEAENVSNNNQQDSSSEYSSSDYSSQPDCCFSSSSLDSDYSI